VESVALPPTHIALGLADAVGALGTAFTVTACEAHVVVLHVPSYLTKYVVFEVGDTVIEFPLPAEVPPQDTEYHCAVAPVPALPPVNVNVVDEPEQIVEVPVIPVGAVLFGLIVTFCKAQVVVLQDPVYLT
jgi:hypothetical protein